MTIKKYLTRSNENKIFAGICGGIGEYLDIDPTVIRALWILSIFLGGFTLFVYLILIFIIPQKKISYKK